jgi:predicted nucleotidyltransferase
MDYISVYNPDMLPLIVEHHDRIAALCRRHGVRRLELFGSAARGDFDSATSDLDFFVEFLSYDSPSIADQWFGLQEDLERVLGRAVDLTSARTVTNPYFLQSANRHRVMLYAA